MLTIAHEQKVERSSYLEDALAKGFAVMQGEEEEPSKTPPLSNLESEDSVETCYASKPDYRLQLKRSNIVQLLP